MGGGGVCSSGIHAWQLRRESGGGSRAGRRRWRITHSRPAAAFQHTRLSMWGCVRGETGRDTPEH